MLGPAAADVDVTQVAPPVLYHVLELPTVEPCTAAKLTGKPSNNYVIGLLIRQNPDLDSKNEKKLCTPNFQIVHILLIFFV